MMNVRLILVFLMLCSVYCGVWAQQSAVEYNNAIVQELNPVSSATAAYLDAATHGRNAADANAKLATLVKTLEIAKTKVAAMPPYNGYTGLRDSIISYINLGYTAAASFSGVLTEGEMTALPFEKVKAFMEMSDVLNDKLTIFSALIKREQKRFGDKNGFSIDKEPKPLDEKFQQVKQVIRYYHKVFLVFFKCNKQEITFIDTLNGGNPASLEAIRNQLQQYTEDAMRRTDTFSAYQGDASLLKANKEALQFFETEAKSKFPLIVDYYQKKGKFDKQSAAVNNIPAKDRTDKMIDSYNTNLKAVNEATVIYNSTNQELNARRIEVINQYNKAISNFLDRNAPRMK